MGTLKSCPYCKKEFGIFRWRYNCDECHKVYCSDCLKKPEFRYLSNNPIPIVDYCQDCWLEIAKPCISKYKKALREAEKMETFSYRYKGRIKTNSRFSPLRIETDWYEDKDEADLVLKVDTAFYGGDIITNLKFENKTETTSSDSGKGVYRFKVWRASGIAEKLE